MNFRVRAQLNEALGSDNRWYCSQECKQSIEDGNALLKHFIKSGGAEDFDRRFTEAMGDLNRWYCSQFYGYKVVDEEILWEYYLTYSAAGRGRETSDAERE